MKDLAGTALAPIRCRGVLHFYGSHDPRRERPCLVVTAPRVSIAEARERLSNMARVHRLVAGPDAPHIPGVVDVQLDGPNPQVFLDCEVVADGDHVADFVYETGTKTPHAAGAALIIAIMRAITALHRVGDSCLGALARANILFAADGRMWLMCGAGPLADAYIAPEVACGGPPTQSADVYSVISFLRGQIALTDMHPVVQRVFAGRLEPGDDVFAERVAWSMRVLAMAPHERPTMERVLEHVIGTWRMLDFSLDYAEYAAWASRMLATGPERLADVPAAPCIRLGRDGAWLETPNGMHHSLRARRSLRRLLVALAEARRDRSGLPLTVDDLLQAGWPGETPLPEAGSNRVYVAISSLRQLGLNELLQRWDGGYRLDPAIAVQLDV